MHINKSCGSILEKSAPALRYLWEGSLDDRKILPIAIISLAIKGFLRIDKRDHYYLVKILTTPQASQHGEQVILNSLFRDDVEVEVSNRHSKIRTRYERTLRNLTKSIISQAGTESDSATHKSLHRILLAAIGIMIFAGIIAASITGESTRIIIGIAFYIVGCVLIAITFPNWRNITNRSSFDRSPGVLAFVIDFTGLLFGIGGLLFLYLASPYIMLFALLVLVAVIVTYFSIPKRTAAEIVLHEQLCCLRDELSGKTKAFISFGLILDDAVSTFEKYLPYAFALNVEKCWVDRFTVWLETNGKSNEYQQQWFAIQFNRDLLPCKLVSLLSEQFTNEIEIALQPFSYTQ